jgi:cation-transporting ATPase I
MGSEGGTDGEPRLLHAVTGRVRVHVPGWSGQGKRLLETQVYRLQGIQRVQANPITGNVLVTFDPAILSRQVVLRAFQALDLASLNDQPVQATLPPVARDRRGKTVRARIAVRGLDRDPHLAKRVVERLAERPGVLVRASALTGRVLVEFVEHETELDDLLAEVADLELPDLPGEDRPAYPLDPGPLLQSVARLAGATLGLGLLAARRLSGHTELSPGAEAAAYVSGMIGLFQGLPALRHSLRQTLGRTAADLLVNIPGIVSLTLAGSSLGLTLVGVEALRLLSEVQARRTAWKQHEARVARVLSAQPDALVRLESGERPPLAALVHSGSGTATGLDAMPFQVVPGVVIPPGARVYGGPYLVQLKSEASFAEYTPLPRPAPVAPNVYDRYQRVQALVSLTCAGLAALFTRSFSRVFTALLLVNPRTASIGMDGADLHASARVLRAGVTIVGTRPGRSIRRPDLLLLDGARLLTDRLEVSNVIPLSDELSAADAQARAAGIASAAGSPWGSIFHSTRLALAGEGRFDGLVASAVAEGVRYTLGPVQDWQQLPEAAALRQRGNQILALCREQSQRPLALFALRPSLAPGVQLLVSVCQRCGVELALLSQGDELALRSLARRAQIALLEGASALEVIARRQRQGELVAFVSDHAGAMAGFAACDLAIGLSDDRSHLPARADLLAPDLAALAAIIAAGVQRDATVRDAVGLSILSNLAGIIWGLRGAPGVASASRVVYITALCALADGWLRLHGGKRAASTTVRLVDPQPERWGRRSVADTLHLLNTTSEGLSSRQARERRRKAPEARTHHALQVALLEQVRSPLTGLLAAGALLSLLLGSPGDCAIIGATITANALIGLWQERKASQVAEALRQIGIIRARVLRDGQQQVLTSDELVPGDIVLLAAGDRVAADARVIDGQGLEVDEAVLTGESFPVARYATDGNEARCIVLEGSDVTTGSGRAAVVAVGDQTRLGATRLALLEEKEHLNPLGARLGRILRLFLPLSVAGGATVVTAGLLWRRQLTALLATGATVALAGMPEGLPLLSRVGEAGVARRLARHQAIVRRISSVEALGRVDVVCADKTGTMTRGHLHLGIVADIQQEATLAEGLGQSLTSVLLTAALASPHPEAQGARAHPTDVAIVQGAIAAGLGTAMDAGREAELSFDPARSFHVTLTRERLCVKGAPEVVLSRCRYLCLSPGERSLLDEGRRAALLQRARQLAARGLRLLMVAEGTHDTALDDPQELTALGFVGIHDPLRPTVREAVRRCHAAGVRVMMITGDHPATARTIAQEAGLLTDNGEVLSAADIADLQNGDLDCRLQHAAVVARATPLDKLRIVESLRRQGHTVAMTGDGVNDAPALRLADIGVAMGRSGTEVARQTADVVIADDDFSTLVEGFVEGRSFWRNMRRALGLLLGGNLGELGLVVGASLLGRHMPLTVGQILAVNALTDILPALAVILQQPEHRDLVRLQREGASTLEGPLMREVLGRGLATALPSLAAYLLTLNSHALPHARSVAFASVVLTQLTQTLLAGRAAGRVTRPVLGAVGGSLGILLAVFSIPPLRRFLELTLLPPSLWLRVAASALVAPLVNLLYSTTLPASQSGG